jgi:exopolyphosphatase/guanosine-5'-triphosphate,3'-diphosphate pyrophosphatase
VAGADLGSNSFHLLVARAEEDGRVHVLDRLRDPVRLAAGLDSHRQLKPAALDRALAALERFGERLRGMPSSAVRAVGTNTLRQLRNAADVEESFSRALGHPIEIISGREEARLIYLGVVQSTPELGGRRLVLDIGGGSTECIIGAGKAPIVLDSLYMGCVSFTRRFFPKGRMNKEGFRQAEIAASLELSSIRKAYRQLGWDTAVGSSGTILAVQEVLRQNGWAEKRITLPAVDRLRDVLIQRKHIEGLSLAGLEADRAAVFAGGVAILRAAFEQLGIEEMATSSGALREGLVQELLGRVEHQDPRDLTIETFASRYKVDRAQAERVARTAQELLQGANRAWRHEPESAAQLLGWAALLHEIGLSIAYSGYQKHGAYILEHAEMPGFSIDDQSSLAAIVGAHRRKLTRRTFGHLTSDRRELALRLTVLLRLSVRLHHSRSEEPLPALSLSAEKGRITLAFPAGWLEARPLTRADLEEEAAYLARAGIPLLLSDSG